MASVVSIPLLLLAFSFPLTSFSSRIYRADVGTKETDHVPVELAASTQSMKFNPSRVLQLSWHPRIFLYESFLSGEECDHLMSLANSKLKKSMVVDNYSKKGIVGPQHTSSGIFLAKDQVHYNIQNEHAVGGVSPMTDDWYSGVFVFYQDEIIARIEDRISAWTFLPKENGEPMRILHYGPGEKYDLHHDYYQEKSRLADGGHRIAAVLIYLSNVTYGGETIFPNLEVKDSKMKDNTWSYCGTTAYAVKPCKGTALLFFTLHPNATTDESSLHGGCPVIEGENWTATKWLHVRSIDSSTDECTDEDNNCPQWAALGECQRNPVFMVGSPDYYGTCRKSCNVC